MQRRGFCRFGDPERNSNVRRLTCKWIGGRPYSRLKRACVDGIDVATRRNIRTTPVWRRVWPAFSPRGTSVVKSSSVMASSKSAAEFPARWIPSTEILTLTEFPFGRSLLQAYRDIPFLPGQRRWLSRGGSLPIATDKLIGSIHDHLRRVNLIGIKNACILLLSIGKLW